MCPSTWYASKHRNTWAGKLSSEQPWTGRIRAVVTMPLSPANANTGYFWINRKNMNGSETTDAGDLARSGAVAAANTVPVSIRMKRLGQRWDRDGNLDA